jgi:exopolysaccharide biosynthesis protein
VAPGAEIRHELWKSEGNNTDTVSIARFNLSQVHLSIGYQPDQPLYIHNWAKQAGALAMINGGYFDENNNATALLISDGQVSGATYDGFGGMLAVDAQGNVTLRSLLEQPYDPANEQLQQATQSAPMLVINGKRTEFQANAASQRRSIAALDKQGRLLLIVSPSNAFSLDETADLLVASDLEIQTALNLDGGGSTGLYVKGKEEPVDVDSLTPVPIAIIIK